jgi:hypothetical protein
MSARKTTQSLHTPPAKIKLEDGNTRCETRRTRSQPLSKRNTGCKPCFSPFSQALGLVSLCLYRRLGGGGAAQSPKPLCKTQRGGLGPLLDDYSPPSALAHAVSCSHLFPQGIWPQAPRLFFAHDPQGIRRRKRHSIGPLALTPRLMDTLSQTYPARRWTTISALAAFSGAHARHEDVW